VLHTVSPKPPQYRPLPCRKSVQVSPGSYELLVRKPVLPEVCQRINVGPSGLTVQVRLGAVPRSTRYTLEVTSNVSDAEVFLNNSKVGTVPKEGHFLRGIRTII